MYVARFELGAEEWIQTTAAIDAGGGRGSLSSAWDLIAGQLSAAARIPRSTVAYRLSLDERRRLRQTVAFAAPSEFLSDVRDVVGRLTRIEGTRGGVVALPADRDERDRWMTQIGALRLCASAAGFSVAGVPLACNFRLTDALDEVLTNAAVAGSAVTYQIHVRAAEVSTESTRSARKSMLALRGLPGVRPALADWQDQLARALGEASALCEEYLAVDDPAAARSIEQLLADRFRAKYGALGFPPAAYRFGRDSFQEPLSIGIHSHDIDPFSPVDLCSVAEPAAGRDTLLAWQPSARLQALLSAAKGEDDECEEANATMQLGDLPEPYAGHGPAVFVSYKRADIKRVCQIIRTLQTMGLPVWYDRGIPGGAEWDEIIEDRLKHAPFVVLCASQAAIESKYVRREVKFADVMDVPLVPVLLEDVSMRHGMSMLLTQYQMLDARLDNFTDALGKAVARLS